MEERLIIGGIIAPTGSGKTAFSVNLAQKYGAEIINADSRQIFKDFKVGTAQPNSEEISQVKHHLVDFASPDQEFSAGHFQKAVHKILSDNPQKKFLIVGGTGFYFKAIKEGLNPIPNISEEIRLEVLNEIKGQGVIALHESLKEFDEYNYNRLNPTDTHRVGRAVEVFRETGKSWAWYDQQPKVGGVDFPIYAIERERELLYKRINKRCRVMLNGEWQEEVRDLLSQGYKRSSKAMKSLGYQEVIKVIDGHWNDDEAYEYISQATRRYAKRQVTYLKNQLGEIDYLKSIDDESFVFEPKTLMG